MQHLEGSGTSVLYIWDARFLKVKFGAKKILLPSSKKPIRTSSVAEMSGNHFCYGNERMPALCITVVIHLVFNIKTR